ncbi:site-specific integrase [Rouxiella badensis]|uniref:site-specific integrase n=1 Tax=Rouxiella badensis TaxID=1646377 RepID=UPI001D13A8A1|nr:site-specific integrase [Rouxiella badensis]MCC3735372.1 site-specific integrase [Rouxiella badensis]MCC3760669.1 site-specific integrase [Rouxiella badensis]
MSTDTQPVIRLRHTLFCELTQREERGKWFRIEDLPGTRTGRPALKRALMPYIDNVMAQLLGTTPMSHQMFLAWEQQYLTFDFFIRSSRDALEVKYRYIIYCIEDGLRNGSKNYILKIRQQCCAVDKDIFSLVEKIKLKEPAVEPDVFSGSILRLPPDERKKVIYKLYDFYKTLAEPFKTFEVSDRSGIDLHIISRYGCCYVRELADLLLDEDISDDLAYFEWNRTVTIFKHSLQNTVRAKEISEKKVALAIEFLSRNKREVTYSEITTLVCLDHRLVKRVVDQWEKRTATKLVKKDAWKTISLDELIATLDPVLCTIPLTFLDSPATGKPMTDAQIRMIYEIKQPGLRNTAFFIMATCYSNRRNDITFFYYMPRFLNAIGLDDIDQFDCETFFKAYHHGDIIPEDNVGQRARIIQTYFRLLIKQGDYFSKLNTDQREKFSPFALPRVSDDLFWKKSTLHREVSQDQKNKRKSKTAVLHQKFYFLRDFVERRKLQINRLHQEIQKAFKRFEKSGKKTPLIFEYTESVVMENRGEQVYTHRFKVWDARLLRQAHEHVAEARTYRYRDNNPHHTIHDTDAKFTTYEGSFDKHLHPVEGLWFTELITLAALTGSPSAEITARYGISKASFQGPITTPHGYTTSRWQHLLSKDLGLIFIPVEVLMFDALLAHSVVQIMSKTGARAHEFLQIRLIPEHLYRINLAENKECILFNAVPKGRLKEEPFYIDNKCMESLYEWWSYQRSRAQTFPVIKAAACLGPKLKPASYLWQNDEKHFTQKDINGALSVMLHGLSLKTPAGQPVKVTSHLLRHSFATEMRTLNTPLDVLALLMKQKDVKVTEYYARHTPSQLVELQQQIFTQRHDFSKQHIRTKADIAQQLTEAVGKVGALIPVTGGCCTIANACPAKFACIGCAGNAPDPARRGDVLVYRDAWVKMAELAGQQNLPAEKRKAHEIIGSCDDMLEEMDLIEQVDTIKRNLQPSS